MKACCLLLAMVATLSVFGANEGQVTRTDRWNGYERKVIDFGGWEGWLVEPKNPRADGRWVWCMKWPGDYKEETGQLDALERGYRYVYFDNHGWMNEEGVRRAKEFRDYLVAECGLAEKADLIGMSWGGFGSVRYAAAYPEDVAAVYLDAPLMNFDGFNLWRFPEAVAAWPAEVGHDWSSDPRMPVNLAGALAASRLPILLLYGDADRTVFPALNIERFLAAYRAAGGTRLEKHVRSGMDHMPHGYQDPADRGKVVDFFERYPVSGARRPLVDPADADYLRRKWREDVTTGGLAIAELIEGGARLAKSRVAAGVPWRLAKAETFAWMCDNMGVAASEHDFFPAISPYMHDRRPMVAIAYWRNREVDAELFADEARRVKEGWERGRFSMWKDFDHSVPDWETLFAGGWPLLEARLKRYEQPTPYFQALRITLDACQRTLGRFAAAAREAAAHASTAAGRARLERSAAAFEAIRTAPPRTVYEVLAFQFSYFFLSEHLDAMQVRSLGALDQLLAPYYRADLAAGRITPDEFRTLLAHYWWQWGSINNYWGQPIAVGGTLPDGTSAYNEVSDSIFEVHGELNLPAVKLLAKVATNTSDRVLETMLDLARRHQAITFDGEETMTRILRGWRGCTDEECRTCDLNGCYEFYVHAKQNVTQSAHVSFLQPVCELLEKSVNAPAGGLPASFEDFKAAYLAELRRNATECLEISEAWERHLADVNPANLFTIALESAIRDGKDAYADGQIYNDSALLSVGLGTAVDALLAVKEIVYERHELTLPQLGGLMAANWQGGEELRRRMLRSKRKWGNNIPEANELGAELVHALAELVNGRPNSRGGIWGFSGHPAKQFIQLMAHTGATPDGRLKGEESSKNLSATMGMDTEGVTALIRSVSHLDPLDLPVNFPLDVMLHPSTADGAKGLKAMRDLTRVYFANGGITLQFNVFSVEELKDAQLHPERYEALQVRVCGWNVRWNDLPRSEQDKYIERAENIMR